ncbi:hypothetical protein COCOBI_01-7770 [Coccomyxa sp. Obi]|nr:hypothetical protein COCOBI_01-7770 [Coccomyxa sp. Obi]
MQGLAQQAQHTGCPHLISCLTPRRNLKTYRIPDRCSRAVRITCCTPAWRLSQAPGEGTPDQAEEPLRTASSLGMSEATSSETASKPVGIGGRIKRFFLGDKLDKERIKALGLGAVASYGFVSNLTYGTGLAVAWIAFVGQVGKSPLMAGQWKAFLAFYAGFWTIQNFVRPLRFSVALAMAPLFEKGISAISRATGFSRRNAFGVYLFILGSVTSILVFGSIFVFAGPLAYSRV